MFKSKKIESFLQVFLLIIFNVGVKNALPKYYPGSYYLKDLNRKQYDTETENRNYANFQRCSSKLEIALEHMLRRSNTQLKSTTRMMDRWNFATGYDEENSLKLTPYSIYHTIYGGADTSDDKNEIRNSSRGGGGSVFNDKNRSIQRVEVADLRVKWPTLSPVSAVSAANQQRWVEVDKCEYIAANRTLDTRLRFPDLTISGRVIVHPIGGHCQMILRLRRAGIEFRTIPLAGGSSGGGRVGNNGSGGPSSSVRTDSHFAEPGFLSVFAHGCRGAAANFVSKEFRNSDLPDVRSDEKFDEMNFNDVLPNADNSADSSMERQSSRTFGNGFFGFGGGGSRNRYRPIRPPVPPTPSYVQQQQDDEISAQQTMELEQLFSMGVRGLLTTYMQKALQPAIKETLMENLGYTVSYG